MPQPNSAPAERLSLTEKIAYGLGDTASNFYFQAFNLFLFYYYTDIYGLNAGAVAMLMLVARVLDAVMDPLMGVVADRTKTRWGKFRPYILWGSIPYGLAGYLMFANPALSEQGKLIYAYVTYIGVWIAYTVINIPYSALMGVMSPSSADRTSLSTFRFACAFSGGFLISSTVLPLKDLLGGDNPADGFKYTMGVFAVLSVVLFLFTFWKTRERVAPPADQDTSLKKDFSSLLANGPWLVLFGVAFLTLTNVGVRNAAVMYFFKYNVGDESKATLFMTLGSLVFIGGSLSTKLFLRYFERRALMIWLTVVNGACMFAFYWVDPQNLVLLHTLNIIGTMAAGPTPAIVWSMYADAADYGQWKTGRRATGLVFSAAVFAQKIGLAVGSALLGWILQAHGFVANAAQSEQALHGILLVFSVIPGTFAILSGFAIYGYSLNESKVKQIERDLAAGKNAV